MILTKEETAILILSNQEGYNLPALINDNSPNEYAEYSQKWASARGKVDNGYTTGIDYNDNEVDLSEFPWISNPWLTGPRPSNQ